MGDRPHVNRLIQEDAERRIARWLGQAPASRPIRSDTRWQTADEVRFLNGIGEHRKLPKHRRLLTSDKIALLKKYLSAMEHRHDWGDMDPDAVRRHAGMLIHSYTALSQPKGA
jgi:hypothetical protein